MEEGYVNVMKSSDLAYVVLVYVLHATMLFMQFALAAFLLVSGGQQLKHSAASGEKAWSALRVVLGLLLLAPYALAAPVAVSLGASIVAFGLLLSFERRAPAARPQPSRLAARAAAAFAALAALMMVWERQDNIAMGSDLLLSTREWRAEEIAWQQFNDSRSPKVGEMAPDFALQDPSGEEQIRLSDFRGKRPVALVFGSYT
jgi:hypothetical protein